MENRKNTEIQESSLPDITDREDTFRGVLDEKYLIIRKVGCGGTSSVYLAYSREDKEKTFLAIKMIDPKKQDTKVFKTEVEMLKTINNKHVVKIVDSSENAIFKKNDGRSKLVNYLVLEYIKNGELFDFIFFPQKGFGEELGKIIFMSILDGLSACHKAGVVHRDLKTENIMVSEEFELKIADFGFAAYKKGRDGKGLLYTSLGTPNYAAPELHLKSPYYGVCNDIFSLAVTLFVIVTGSMPFKTATQNDVFYPLIMKNDYETYWTKRGLKLNLSDNFKSLFCNRIAYDYTQRPSIEEILTHPWLQDFEFNEDSLKMLKFDFYKRKQVVDFKRMKEKVAREEEKKGNKVTINRAYRSSNDFSFAIEMERKLETYEELGNQYNIIFPEGTCEHTLFKKLIDLIEMKGFIVSISDNKFRLKLELQSDSSNYNVSSNSDENFIVQNLKIIIDIKRFVEDKIIVEFIKRSGDRFLFFEIYEDISKSFN